MSNYAKNPPKSSGNKGFFVVFRDFGKLLIERRLFFLGVLLALFFMILDLSSKSYIFAMLDKMQEDGSALQPILKITGFFNLVQVWNRGVSFGMMNDLTYGKVLISTVNILITVVLLVWLYRAQSIYLAIAISFIVGGALGNLTDRFMNDAVADFLDFHIMEYHWPAFNLADSFVFIGVSMLLLENFFVRKSDAK